MTSREKRHTRCNCVFYRDNDDFLICKTHNVTKCTCNSCGRNA